MPQLIGTRNETSLHRDLKYYYSGQDGQIETEVAGFVTDGISAAGEFIEVQTGSFGRFKQKAKALAAQGRLRIVYPVIITKYIEVFDTEGNRLSRRKSNKKGTSWDIFNDLIYAPDLPLVSGIVMELALVDVVELRVRDGKGSWRRSGVSIQDRRMTALNDRICLEKPSDYLRFLPFTGREQFTSAMLGEKAGIRPELARKTLYSLTMLGVVRRIGKKGNAQVYRITIRKKKAKISR